MAEQDWAKVLNYLYEGNGVFFVTSDAQTNEIEKKEELRRRLEGELQLESTTDKELRILFNNLEIQDLAEIVTESDWAELRLTNRGFDVAHERELNKRQEKTNRLLGILTGGLVYAALAQSQIMWYQNEFSTGRRAYLLVTNLIIAGLIYYGFRRFEVI